MKYGNAKQSCSSQSDTPKDIGLVSSALNELNATVASARARLDHLADTLVKVAVSPCPLEVASPAGVARPRSSIPLVVEIEDTEDEVNHILQKINDLINRVSI
jgi:hypothetical protein